MHNPNPCRTVPGLRAATFGRLALALIVLAASVAPAAGQLGRIGDNPIAIWSPARGTDAAWDPVNQVYLVVGARAANDPIPMYGVFVDAFGNAVTSTFQINVPGAHAHFPRVIYSPDVPNGAGGVGGFLVTWNGGFFTTNVRARIVAYPNRLVSGEIQLPGDSNGETGAAVAYSNTSDRFLVVWRAGSAYSVWGALLATNGQPVSSAFLISDSALGARDPNVAWNPHTNEFGVIYTGFGPAGANTTFARVTPFGALARNTFYNSFGTYITDLAVNTANGRFVGVWRDLHAGTLGAEFGPAGDVVAQGLVSTTTGTYDGMGLSYNANSGTFLLVGQGPSADIWAAELNSRGARTSADTTVTSAGGPIGSFYPRATARSNAPQWNITFAHNFAVTRNQIVATSSSGGGPSASLGAPPPTSGGGTSTGGCPGTAPFPGAVCVNGGWVPGSTSGTSSGGCIGNPPFPGAVCVNGGWVPGSTSGTSSGSCAGTAPFPGAICVNGGWVPGSTSGGTSSGGCAGTAPFPGAVCVNGGWVPGSTSGGTSSGGCAGTAPFPGAVCVNGGWVPGSTSGTSSGGCIGNPPFPGAVCVNGGWVPGGTSGTSTGGCLGTAPFPGAVCVNGGWVPGGTSTSGGCSTPDPFTAIGGGTCVNGGWIPGTSTSSSGGCTTPSPGSGWVCVNGGWLPPTMVSGSSSCSSPSPGPGWVCVSGGWLPPDNPLAISYSSGGCSTPDPFTAMGGGICINGGWVPR